jgi:integrase/recombinase XerD
MVKSNNLLNLVEQFLKHLKRNENFSVNTFSAYGNDINHFIFFLSNQNIKLLEDLSENLIIDYFNTIKKNYKGSTLRRNKSSIKKFLSFIKINYKVDFTKKITDIKSESTAVVEYKNLSIEEISNILENIKGEDFFSKRDKAIFLTLYSTAIRASELKNLKMKDLNLNNRFLEIKGKFSRRLLFGEIAANAIGAYILERKKIMKMHNKSNKGFLFVERNGNGLTRQSIYLVVRKRAIEAGIKRKISPQMLRNSIYMHLLSSGVRVEDLKEMLGNKTLLPYFEKKSNEKSIDSVYISSHPILLDK